MARNDPYLPDFATVADGGSTTFDGSASSTGTAIVNEIAGDFDAEIYIEESNDGGTSWTQIAQLRTEQGKAVFDGPWHTQFNRLYVSSGARRLLVSDAGAGGVVSVTGDER